MKIRYNREIISGAIFVVLSAVLWFLIPVQVQTLEKTPINAQTFPRIAIGGMFLCSVGLLLEGIFVREKQELYVTKESFRSNAFKKEMRSVVFALLLIAYCFLIGHLGYIVSTILLVLAVMMFYKARKWYYYAIVVDVKNKFAALPIDGVQSNLEGFPGSYDPTVNHIQGYAQYDSCDHTRYSILTHSVGTAPYAHIVAGPKTGSDKWGFKTYLQNWKHPGGVQVMGDYLLVPSEQDASAHIALYDLRSLAVKELRRVETFDLAVSHKAGALGITSYEDKNGIEYYVMIVAHLDGENTVYHVYRALASNGIENARFSEVGSFESDKDFQGFGLITEDGTNDIYMIGLWSPSEGVTFADYAYLYQLNTETWTIGEALQQIHMVSVGGMAGMMGVHFRYGANVYVADDGTLTLSATERNSVLGSSLATNDWIPAIVN